MRTVAAAACVAWLAAPTMPARAAWYLLFDEVSGDGEVTSVTEDRTESPEQCRARMADAVAFTAGEYKRAGLEVSSNESIIEARDPETDVVVRVARFRCRDQAAP
ncbi:MAG TPA: hypothetical protein VGU22_19805 [Methylomirabilota bacterium]|nr:hypothetical protein [Methylomirabilota bacterium]